jgi:hypothetical protein
MVESRSPESVCHSLPSPCLLRVYPRLIKRMSYSILMRTGQPISSFCWHVNYLRSFCPPVLRRNSMFMTWAQSRYVFVASFPDIPGTLTNVNYTRCGSHGNPCFFFNLIHGDVNPSAPNRKNGRRNKLVDGVLGYSSQQHSTPFQTGVIGMVHTPSDCRSYDKPHLYFPMVHLFPTSYP